MIAGKRILWGVCGIGHGHTFRQLPIIEAFAKHNRILVFAYGESLAFYQRRFEDVAGVKVAPVAVPFFVGNAQGLDFAATAALPANRQDYQGINAAALALAQDWLGKPDLVVSDYEPVTAQYAYATGAPLVTLDQQSKYLDGIFAPELNGQTYADEIARLRLFFPKAAGRLACSFFKVAKTQHAPEKSTIVPPVLGDAVLAIPKNARRNPKEILLYLSSQRPFGQEFREIETICAARPDITFHAFGKNLPPSGIGNLRIHAHGEPSFHQVLGRCGGIVTTAGHTLISEAMYLGIPVYAIPLPVYEQEMNAHVLATGGFGISHPRLEGRQLDAFLEGLPRFSDAIKTDRACLLRRAGQSRIIRYLERTLRAE